MEKNKKKDKNKEEKRRKKNKKVVMTEEKSNFKMSLLFFNSIFYPIKQPNHWLLHWRSQPDREILIASDTK